MKEVTDKNFGMVIAFMLPGFILAWSLTLPFPALGKFFQFDAAKETASIGGFLNISLASLALGLQISAVRWALLDRLLSRGLPDIDFSSLKDKDVFGSFIGVVENHYRYYQYYSNSFVAVAFGYTGYLISERHWGLGWVTVITGGLLIILYLASKDCLKKYHRRGAEITKAKAGGATA